ncbi:putative Phosphoserine phosphatase [Verrucomicrobia bacterium]|nr:putative Phosphoserine phosphatase [Verrucomicrobiota bacterium]
MRNDTAILKVSKKQALVEGKPRLETLPSRHTANRRTRGLGQGQICRLPDLSKPSNSLNPSHAFNLTKLPTLPGFGLSGFCFGAQQASGDFFDVLPAGHGALLLVVADVMGHGAPAAHFAAVLRKCIRALTEVTLNPAELLAQVNRAMFSQLSPADTFITAQVALADAARRQLTVASAGHCPLLLAIRGGQVSHVSPKGMPLGILPEVSFRNQVVPLEAACRVCLYTDGITEARNADGQFLGSDPLARWLAHDADQTAAQICEEFLCELQLFQSPSQPRDDQTLLILAEESPCSAFVPSSSIEGGSGFSQLQPAVQVLPLVDEWLEAA